MGHCLAVFVHRAEQERTRNDDLGVVTRLKHVSIHPDADGRLSNVIDLACVLDKLSKPSGRSHGKIADRDEDERFRFVKTVLGRDVGHLDSPLHAPTAVQRLMVVQILTLDEMGRCDDPGRRVLRRHNWDP